MWVFNIFHTFTTHAVFHPYFYKCLFIYKVPESPFGINFFYKTLHMELHTIFQRPIDKVVKEVVNSLLKGLFFHRFQRSKSKC